MKIKFMKHLKIISLTAFSGFGLFLIATDASAATTVGGMASQILKSFEALAKLITAGSFIAGLGFAVGAIMKFKQHKDNPTQIPVGTPIALVFIAAALIFLPTIVKISGGTMFGADAQSGSVAGVIPS